MYSYYNLTLGFLGFLLLLVLWKLWNYTKPYAEFPSYPLFYHLLIASVLRKIPQHLPFQGFLFQTLIQVTKRFQKEGLFLVWGLQPHLVIFGEEAVKIFSNEEAALDKPYKYNAMRDSFGTGLLTSHAEEWKKQRKMLNPVFHVGMLKNKLSIFNENADILIEKLAESINNPYIDVLDYIKPCAFGGICEYILGLKVNSPENKEVIKNYANMVSKGGKMLVYRFGNPLLYYNFMLNFIPFGREYKKVLNDAKQFTRKMILEMKKNISDAPTSRDKLNGDESENDQETQKSFAHILLDHHLKDPSFTIEDLESQVTTFMAAGYETVAYSIMWCLFLLGHHPDVQDQAYSEVESLTKGHIKYEDLLSLKYLDCVVKETLRVYPTAPIYGRRLSKDIQCGKYIVPKDTTITFFPYALHRNPKTFPDPEKFNPDRFMDGNIEKLPWNFTPFAEGIRFCIGKRFALLEIKVVLCHILRHFRIRSLDKPEEVDLCWEIVLAPAKPLRFKLTPRK